MIAVFYDGKCSLCHREIAHYRTIAPVGVFDWVDITVDASRLAEPGIGYDDALRRLHAEAADGSLHVGVDAFLLIWRHLPRWRLLAFVVGLPGILGLASFAYRVFAEWRFKRLGYANCAVPVK